ncbi:MAG: hypothetical protein U0U69_11235 [Acidimicrobiia bacterium]
MSTRLTAGPAVVAAVTAAGTRVWSVTRTFAGPAASPGPAAEFPTAVR